MCGIAGILGEVSKSDGDRVSAMNASQRHRGPDSDDVSLYEGAVLGHRRLSIIDLSNRSRQPMESSNGRFSITYNGELYNYKELRAELKSSYDFKTESDTEVLLAAWSKWGEDCLYRMRGMFAFCIWDRESRSAFFARDRFGQKPMFFSFHNGQLLFASEVKALLAAGVPASPDMNTWSRYLVSAVYDNTEDSFFGNIEQLRPGESATWSEKDGMRRRRYYDLSDHVSLTTQAVSLDEASNRVREILIDVSRMHMQADVPVGVALSGGLDSSALLACLDLAGELKEQLHCYSFDFGESLTERPWIEAAAAYHGLKSEINSFTPDQYLESIRPLMWHLEGPIGGLANCALANVFGAAQNNGIVVLQDGTGLDEAFAGYEAHHKLALGVAIEKGGDEARSALIDFCKTWGVNEESAIKSGKNELDKAIRGKQTAVDGSVPTRPDLLQSGFLSYHPGDFRMSTHVDDPLRDSLINYTQVQKIPRNMRFKDRLSMAYSTELRLPFLDHVLVEYALSLPASYYFLYGRTKSIVREALKGAMDETVRIAKKRSIQAPQGAWLIQEPMKSYVGDLINSQSFKDRGIFDISAVIREFDKFCKGGMPNSFFVWQWINTEEWFRMFVDKSTATIPESGFISYAKQSSKIGV
jgi:asparagine synthase (glutamine-hydrolysing)